MRGLLLACLSSLALCWNARGGEAEAVTIAPEAWQALQPPTAAEEHAWDELAIPDSDAPDATWDALRPLVARNEPALAKLPIPGTQFAKVLLPPTLWPETSFPDHWPLRIAGRLACLRARLLARDSATDEALRQLADAGALPASLLLGNDGIIPLIQFTGMFSDWLDCCLWFLRHAENHPERLKIRGEVLRLLRQREGVVRRGIVAGFSGELALFERVVRRMPPPGSPAETILDAFSVLGDPEFPTQGVGFSRFGMPRESWFDPDATVGTLRGLLQPWAQELLRVDAVPPQGLYANRIQQLRDDFAALTGDLQPLLDDYETDLGPTPYLPFWLERFNGTPNGLGLFLVTMMASPFEVIAESSYMREAQRRALIVLASGEADPGDAPADIAITDLERMDPFNGAPLRIDPATASVWCVGRDRTDSEGREGDLLWSLRP